MPQISNDEQSSLKNERYLCPIWFIPWMSQKFYLFQSKLVSSIFTSRTMNPNVCITTFGPPCIIFKYKLTSKPAGFARCIGEFICHRVLIIDSLHCPNYRQDNKNIMSYTMSQFNIKLKVFRCSQAPHYFLVPLFH